MLSLIRIKNYAVVDEAEVEFAAGFSVLTGETGAGKSILVDALGLALGDRADAGAVRQGSERAEISVQFDCPPGHAALGWLKERGLEDDDACTLRRLIGTDGRSRGFVNGQPATLQDLKAVGALLVDIHGQHAHQSLLEAPAQRALLDAYGGLDALARDVAEAYGEWQSAAADLARRTASDATRSAELELVRFQAGELETLGLVPGEVETLKMERDRLANTDKLLGGVSTALERLTENEDSAAYSAVVQARQELERLALHDAALGEQSEQLAAIEILLRDVESTLARYRDRIEADPGRLDALEERLAKIRSLSRRHGVPDEQLAGLLAPLRERLAALESGEESLAALEAKTARIRSEYFLHAAKLGAAREKHARKLEKAVSSELAELGMPHGELHVDIRRKSEERADSTGTERIEFQVRLNPGQAFGPLSRVASGGELSRISLAIEVVRTGASPVPTLVFDEVDAGIGGRVAEIVGRKLDRLARQRQVLCVTHLPQVASQGRCHYRVLKLTDGKTSRTNVRLLTADERLEELARMLGGVEITERVRAHAAELIDRAAR